MSTDINCPICDWQGPSQKHCPQCSWTLQSELRLGPVTPEEEAEYQRRIYEARRAWKERLVAQQRNLDPNNIHNRPTEPPSNRVTSGSVRPWWRTIPQWRTLLAVIGLSVLVFALLAVCAARFLPICIIDCHPTPTATVFPTITITSIPTAIPTATLVPVPIGIDKVDPVRLTGATRPWNVTVTGNNLLAVQTLELQPADQQHETVTLPLLTQSDTQITLNLDNLYHIVRGQVTYTLVINNQARAQQIIVQDFIHSAQVQGVSTDYRDRDPRLFFNNTADGFGAYLWNDSSLQTKISASPRPGDVVISRDDTLEILGDAQHTHTWPVYEVRVRSNRIDGDAVIGKTGWISQWLVDGRPIPVAPTPVPIPTPPPSDFQAVILAIDDSTNCAGGPGMSHIDGTVYDRDRGIIYDARVQIIPLDGQGTVIESANGRNYAARDLRCGRWRVQIVAVGDRRVVDTWVDVHVTGDEISGAVIDFHQQ